MGEVIKDNGYNVRSSDLFDRGYGDVGIDFLSTANEQKVANIITNPPYKIAEEFVYKALSCTSGKVAFLLKLNFLESARRYELFKNTPLKQVIVFSKRLSFYAGTLKGDKRSGVLAYAWYVWEHGYDGYPMIDWIKENK